MPKRGTFFRLEVYKRVGISLGLISAVFSSPVFDPPEKDVRGKSAGPFFSVQRLVIEPRISQVEKKGKKKGYHFLMEGI